MVNFPNPSYVIKIGAPPYYNRNNRYGRHLPVQHHPLQHPPPYHPLYHLPLQHYLPIDKTTWELFSELVPLIQQLNFHGEDLAYDPSNDLMKSNNHDFHINLDVGRYTTEELSAKIISDHLVIEGKHDERKADDIGYVTRHFIRRYGLPKGYNPDAIVCKLSSDGVLSVSLLLNSIDKPEERIITIHQADPNDAFLQKSKSVKFEKEKCDKDNTNDKIKVENK